MSLNCIKHKIKFPQVKGSIKRRTTLTEIWNKRVFHEILRQYGDNELLPIRSLERTYKSLLPTKVPLTVKKNLKPDDPVGCLDIYYNEQIIPNRMTLSIYAENNSMHISDFPEFMHESTHLFDTLFQPKILQSQRQLLTKDFSDDIEYLYENYFYTDSKNMIQMVYNLLKTLKNKTNEDKIIILKYLKSKMQAEVHAYQEGKKYRHLLNEEENVIYKDHKFEKKIKIVNFMLENVIKKERKSLPNT